MKRLIFVFVPFIIFSKELSIAVLPFHNASSNSNYAYFSLLIPDRISEDLQNLEGINVVERERIKFLLTEYSLAQLGIIDDSTLLRVGDFLSANYCVYGDYSIIDSVLIITAKITDIKKGKVLEEITRKGSIKNPFVFIDSLTLKFVERIGYRITGEEKENIYRSAFNSLEKLRKKSEMELEEWSSDIIQDMLVDALNNMGLKFEEKGKYEKAIVCYERSLSINPNQEMIKFRLNRLKRK